MNLLEKNNLDFEAGMQLKMIGNLVKWFRFLIALSAVGVVLIWWGISKNEIHIIAELSGMLFIFISIASACVVAKGIRNGRKNVAKILFLTRQNIK
ncbi:hypothetical protein [Pectinatus sottacetonis]|uniref:hypothetical protein n=1 Tax=Pectinatus sottacetonis TaxID=1002795 RepID=UPI0018C76C9F|nr:hypothetical protein [Pectinatus sottacetonis]